MTNVIKSRLTFLKRIKEGKHARALYKCECGTVKEILEYPVRKGIVVSCGCYLKEVTSTHGMTNHPLYSVWANMKHRCICVDAENYSDYGGRGVRVCQSWEDSFFVFHTWAMANGWQRGLQLDKDIIPAKTGTPALLYSPENCCFVPSIRNNNAKRNNVLVRVNGVVKSITEWSRIYNVTVDTLRRRLKAGEDVDDIKFFRPARNKSPNGSKIKK